MAKIRSKDTKPEKLLRSVLYANGLRFRLHVKHLPGKPDIVLAKYKTVIFVHGCFWHYHSECREGRIPNTNSKFWTEKLSKNIQRDEMHQLKLREAGWQVIVVWECELERKFDEAALKMLLDTIKTYPESANLKP
ncbi:very short patch repair endonuclease [Mucilaginibacter sp.]|uniref:very short patch repair endonuclease n=1 Tax=Mucilaginibacter sp. TaxID=1882438 RepID=UPI0038B335E7